MRATMYLNLPVKDLQRSVAFFTRLGFEFDERVSDDKASGMVLNDGAWVMLLTEPFFSTFTSQQVADAHARTEAIVAVELDDRGAVDEMYTAAVAAGAKPDNTGQDHSPMYGRSFTDLDGHLWEVFCMGGADQ